MSAEGERRTGSTPEEIHESSIRAATENGTLAPMIALLVQTSHTSATAGHDLGNHSV